MTETQDLARVLSTHGRQLRLQLADGREVAAHPPGRRLQLVCGDRVRVGHDARHGEWRVLELLERRGALHRSNLRGQTELLAANLEQLVVVCAPQPEPDPFLVDRYLAAGASAGLDTLVLVNKCELGIDERLQQWLAELQGAETPWLPCSAREGTGLAAVTGRLTGRITLLAGQSGVGKSSLLRVLVPGAEATVGELDREQAGRHTTTATRWHALPGGGALLDSPGVRDFAPSVVHLRARDLGFADIGRLSANCRFADCCHWQEPDCAVRAAASQGTLAPRRLESFRRLWRLREQLLQRRSARE